MYRVLKKVWDIDTVAVVVTIWLVAAMAAVTPFFTLR